LQQVILGMPLAIMLLSVYFRKIILPISEESV